MTSWVGVDFCRGHFGVLIKLGIPHKGRSQSVATRTPKLSFSVCYEGIIVQARASMSPFGDWFSIASTKDPGERRLNISLVAALRLIVREG